MIEVRPVTTRRDYSDFLRVPHIVQGHDPNWVPPLTLERRLHFSHRNPYFAHAEACYFVAYDDRRPVGRISAQIDELAQPGEARDIGHFGCLEARDAETVSALAGTAEGWLADRGIAKLQGPFSLSINDEVGLLVEGFDTPPRMLMNYAPPWYAEALAAAGYTKAKDIFAYRFDGDRPLPDRAAWLADQAETTAGLVERPMDPSRFREELRTVVSIFNDAWSENWGFIPMTEAEAAAMTDNMRPLIRPDMVRFVERDGEPVAMVVALPDLHDAIADFEGRLLPLNWARLVYRLKTGRFRGARVLLMGVRKAHRRGLLGGAVAALLVSRLHAAARAYGFHEVELSWVLEDNKPIRALIETLGGEAYKRYRIFEKALV